MKNIKYTLRLFHFSKKKTMTLEVLRARPTTKNLYFDRLIFIIECHKTNLRNILLYDKCFFLKLFRVSALVKITSRALRNYDSLPHFVIMRTFDLEFSFVIVNRTKIVYNNNGTVENKA